MVTTDPRKASRTNLPQQNAAARQKPPPPKAFGARAAAKPKAPLEPFKGERERQRKAFVERMILGATLTFCFALIFAVWYSEGKVLENPTKFLAQFAGEDALASKDAALNCRHPKNRNTPYCQERTAALESDWKSMGRTQGGKVNPFGLTDKK